jgi:adenine-specific DNA glycosylase
MDHRPPADLVPIVSTLRRHLPATDIPTDPLRMILWENIGYLIDDARRRELFDAFGETVGFDPAAIAETDDETLLPLARRGGMRPETRVQRWRQIARIVLDRCAGDLDGALRRLPHAKARALLKAFPTIGGPGADKVLLFADIAAVPSLESNGLRCLARLGFFEEQASYDRSYKAAIAVLQASGRADRAWLIDAYVGLRELGRTLCRRGEPLCHACPLDEICPHAGVTRL